MWFLLNFKIEFKSIYQSMNPPRGVFLTYQYALNAKLELANCDQGQQNNLKEKNSIFLI